MCYPCDRGIVLPICPGYTRLSPDVHIGVGPPTLKVGAQSVSPEPRA